jgi:predicted TIM-barrel fold metal-dependent hydrolase
MKIDMHSHAFADRIAAKALASIMSHMPAKYRTSYDGRLSTLMGELKAHDFDKAVLCQIATKPAQYGPILDWCQAIRRGDFGEDAAKTIVPLPSVHPDDPDRDAHLAEIARLGFKGVKLHPYFQRFTLDAPHLIDYFKSVRDNGLFAISHTGFDIGFPYDDLCGPRRVAHLLEAVPGLRFMVTHFGGWLDWEEASRILIGAPIDIEISMAIGFCKPDLFREMLLRHPQDRLYFGSDWPWSRYDETLPFLDSCPLPPARREALMGGNAARFLGDS